MLQRFIKVLQSLLAGLIGVQSERKRREDFESGNAADFFIGAVIMTFVILLVTYYIVSYVTK